MIIIIILQLINNNYDNYNYIAAESTAPYWLFPFAKAACSITRYSSFAAIWRLKTFIFRKPKTVTAEFNRPRSIYQYSSMAPRLSGQIANFSTFFCLSIPQRDLDTKKTTPNIEF